MLKRYVLKCFFNIITLGEHVMPSGRVFHSVAVAVSSNRLQSFTIRFLLGTNDVVFADIDIQVLHYEEFRKLK